MKKYSVHITFKNGWEQHFETDTNLKLEVPQYINGGQFIITENEYVINTNQVKEINMIQLR